MNIKPSDVLEINHHKNMEIGSLIDFLSKHKGGRVTVDDIIIALYKLKDRLELRVENEVL